MPILIETLKSLWVRAGPLFNFLYPHGHPTYDAAHQHETVLAALERRDGYMLREAIRQDLIEGGRNFVRHLQAMEDGAATVLRTGQRSVMNRAPGGRSRGRCTSGPSEGPRAHHLCGRHERHT